MPRILRILNRFNLGGPTYNAAYLTKHISSDYDTLLIGGKHNEHEESSEFILNNMGVEALIIPEMQREISPVNDLIAYNKIKQIIREFKPDIVHTHAAKAGMLGRRAAYSLGVPVIVHTFHGHVFHSYFNSVKTATFIQIERALAKRTSKIIAISDLQKKELAEDFKIAPSEKFNVIPLGFDLSRFGENVEEKRSGFRERYNIPSDVCAFGIVGRIVPIKNHHFFIDVVAGLKANPIQKMVAVIIGDGEERQEIEAYAKAKGLNISTRYNEKEKTDIIFTSWIRDVDKVYAGLDIVALTSKNEGTPVSLIEAQASGKPVVSTNAGGINDVVKHLETGLLSEQDDTRCFIDNVKFLLKNQAETQRMISMAKINVKEKYSYNRLVNEMDVLYKELLTDIKPIKKPYFFVL
ncbi:MAG: hypothetical protein CVU05_00565 [Bacteroidetes bacterium HGW-Bacteroidetes-21]|jgi:glycosyltransferase involved in cell wall biosynthesis|nr:MAG: hypothetical protein CVU05_00565 [Bacteroidetes bacterium HGW-Bacteroidetes-21]